MRTRDGIACACVPPSQHHHHRLDRRVCLASAEQLGNVQLTHSDSIIKTFRHINACVRASACVCVFICCRADRFGRARAQLTHAIRSRTRTQPKWLVLCNIVHAREAHHHITHHSDDDGDDARMPKDGVCVRRLSPSIVFFCARRGSCSRAFSCGCDARACVACVRVNR